jgi:tRNA(Phe) wybutosine-synthesizing methylase Tyw3
MSKNNEIIAEIISEQTQKLEKLVLIQAKNTEKFERTIEKAESISVKTDRLEFVIEHWNSVFDRQKQQIMTLQNKQLIDNRTHRIVTYLLLATIVVLIILKLK